MFIYAFLAFYGLQTFWKLGNTAGRFRTQRCALWTQVIEAPRHLKGPHVCAVTCITHPGSSNAPQNNYVDKWPRKQIVGDGSD